jgi:hypothetical protein
MLKNNNSHFVRWAIESGWLHNQKLFLVDVGASGGIHPGWNQFRPNLKAIGFDPLTNEVDRLNAAEKDKDVLYVNAWVSDGEKHEFPSGSQSIFSLLSCIAAEHIKKMDFRQTYFNNNQSLTYTDRTLFLDDYFSGDSFLEIDTLKIDVDSFDYFVLSGAKNILKEGHILAVECECQFHDFIPSQGWPIFAEIDLFMRNLGYRLALLEPYHYTRALLPGPFAAEIPAQTVNGQIMWCNALYILDPSVDSSAFDRLSHNPDKFLKAALLFEVFGLRDIAAAVLIKMRENNLSRNYDIETALNHLVPSNPWGITTYKDYIATFEKDPDQFLPSQWRKAETGRLKESWFHELYIGTSGEKMSYIRSKSGLSGHVFYGPYKRMNPGSYEVEIIFKMPDSKPLAAFKPFAWGSREKLMTAEVVSGQTVLAQCSIYSHDAGPIKLTFEVLAHETPVEIRIHSEGHDAFVIQDVTVKLLKSLIDMDAA